MDIKIKEVLEEFTTTIIENMLDTLYKETGIITESITFVFNKDLKYHSMDESHSFGYPNKLPKK